MVEFSFALLPAEGTDQARFVRWLAERGLTCIYMDKHAIFAGTAFNLVGHHVARAHNPITAGLFEGHNPYSVAIITVNRALVLSSLLYITTLMPI